jgi:mono/diheme cytochrome c family protein
MKTTFQLAVLALAAMTVIVVAQTSNVVLPQDKGPDKLDVSGSPAEMQQAYKLFSTKCSKCHTLARPLNTMMSRAEWERYVKRMMHKPNSGINDKQGKDIFEFLVYDQTSRKDKNPKAFYPALSDEEIQKLKAQP